MVRPHLGVNLHLLPLLVHLLKVAPLITFINILAEEQSKRFLGEEGVDDEEGREWEVKGGNETM